MGIMITYGSYVKKDTDLTRSVNQIEIFDTAVAFLAGMMIIPAVYAFMGYEGLGSSGPGLMFKALPKVDAGLAASIFHFGEVRINELKRLLEQYKAKEAAGEVA